MLVGGRAHGYDGVINDWLTDTTPSIPGRADPQMAGGGVQRLAKSRYDAISCYIYSCQSDLAQPQTPAGSGGPLFPPRMTPRSASGGGGMWGGGDEVLNAYNDVAVEVDEGLEALMLERGVDPILARHVVRIYTAPCKAHRVGGG